VLKREEELAKLAAECDSVASRAQLNGIGYSDEEIQTAIGKKVWRRLQRGVYFLSAGTPTWRQKVRAAMLAAGGAVQLAGRALAAWIGLDGATEGVIEVVVEHGHAGPKPVGVTVHRTRRPSKPRTYAGIRGTSVERLLVDYAALVSTDLAERAVENAMTRGLTAERRIWKELAHLGEAVPGVRALARIMELRPNGKAARSSLEIDALNVIRKAGLPLPTRNYDVFVDDEHFEIDLAYVGALGAIEVDSKRWHSTASQKAKDRHKQQRCESVGWNFVRITAVDVYGRPEWVVQQVRDLLLTPQFGVSA
jgi:hypothetical protein